MKRPKTAPAISELWTRIASNMERYLKIIDHANPTLDGRYLHWDEFRYRTPPGDLTSEEWWLGVKQARQQASTRVVEMKEIYGVNFRFMKTTEVQKQLHSFDRGNVAEIVTKSLGNEDAIVEYRVRQLIEEAISSSEIEGARPTTREVARQLVRENREPDSKDERMILNNWRAMRRIVELRDANAELGMDELLEIHRILGEDALEVTGAAGSLRGPEHDVHVADHEGNVWHQPPPVDDINGKGATIEVRVRSLLEFSNKIASEEDEVFIHPILRAIICHFWMGYEHPFRDGNGRMARALFYWVLLKNRYEMAEFLSISGPIDRAVKQYYRAFAYVETDEGDLTYFILNQLGVMTRALQELKEHLTARMRRAQRLADAVQGFDRLNHRQRSLLQKAVRHPLQTYTIDGHKSSHRVHYQTARADLLGLVEAGYFSETRVGKKKRFKPDAQFVELLEQAQEKESR